MHKDFYASGFLYHPISQKILLQQNSASSSASSWVLLGSLYSEKEDPETVLKNVIFTLLDVKTTTVLPVYAYSNEDKDRSQYIGYSITKTKGNFSSKNGHTFAWFSFRDILKLQIDEQTKHDIVVGQRVIEAAERKRLGMHTFQ